MTVIDCHCHIYPPKIAARAVESVGAFYSIPMDAQGVNVEDKLHMSIY